jgi:hypothetical protein
VLNHPLNSLPKLEPAFASQYRYFWLELALANEGRKHLEGVVDLVNADELLRNSYRVYLHLLVEERIRLRLKDSDIRQLSSVDQKTKATKMAQNEIIDEQSKARKFWFGTPIDEARRKIEVLLHNNDAGASEVHEVPSVDAEEFESDSNPDDGN